MTVLHVPLHLPTAQAERFLYRELIHREVLSCRVQGDFLVIEHDRKPPEPKTGIWL